MISYWGVDHGEEVSKLGSAKVDDRTMSYANLTTRSVVQPPSRGAYQYQGKSLILRRPKYQTASTPGKGTDAVRRLAAEGNLGLKVSRGRWSKEERNALHEAASSGKSYKRGKVTYQQSKK